MTGAQVSTVQAEGNDFLAGLESLQRDIMDVSESLKWIGERTLDLEPGSGCSIVTVERHLAARADVLEGLIFDVRQAVGAEGVSHG